MFENYLIIRRLKKLRNKTVDEDFLVVLKSKLEIYVDANPAGSIQAKRWQLENLSPRRNGLTSEGRRFKAADVSPWPGGLSLVFNFTRLKTMPIPIIIAFIAVFAGGGATVVASQNSLPGDALFSVKIVSEEVRTAFAFSPESRAELQLRFNAERLEEIRRILSERGVEARGLEIAISRLQDNSARAADIVERERRQGREMDDLAGKIDDSLGFVERDLRDALRAREDALKTQEDELKEKLNEARRSGDDALIAQILVQLRDVHSKRVFIETQREGADDFIDDHRFELRRGFDDDDSISEQRREAQEAIINAERERQELLADALSHNVVVAVTQLKDIDDLLASAKSAFAENKFREAKIFAKQSRDLSRSLDDILFDSNSWGRGQEEENEQRGQEQEARGRQQEGEQEQRGQEQEVRGLETEQRGQEPEARGPEDKSGRGNGDGEDDNRNRSGGN